VKREVKSELLDTLSPDDPRAIQSRLDLQRINEWMGHVELLTNVASAKCHAWNRIVEIGAGDGRFLAAVCRQLWSCTHPVELVLVDRQRTVGAETLAEIGNEFWKAEAVTMDVFDWLNRSEAMVDVIVANLFLHHFEEGKLRELLRLAARRTDCLIACEPRRAWHSLCASRLVGLIGCNEITRHDAFASVRAGFRKNELSELWPAEGAWELYEKGAGLFSHLFVARRMK
jgi:hypothetical protein